MKNPCYKKIDTIMLVVVIIMSFAFLFGIGNAQEHSLNQRNATGMLINQDYFTADQNPEVKNNLSFVEAYHLNQRVLADFSAGRYSTVQGDLRYALDKFPNHPKALMLMGAVAAMTKAPALAIAFYEKALKLYPQYALTHAQYGKYLGDIGNTKAGIAELERAIQIDPKLTQARVWLAKIHTKAGN